jgi:signal peptidase II
MQDESAAGAASSRPLPRPAYAFLVVVTLVNLVADLATKWWAKTTFEGEGARRGEIVLFEKLFDRIHLSLIYAKNRGGAWGLLQSEAESLRRPFFLVVSVAAIVFIVSLYRKLTPDQRILKWGLPLVLGGALGNLVDRVRYGFVVDFIDVYVLWGGREKHWPTFNVADISICVGVAFMAIDMFTSRAPQKKPSGAPESGEPSFRPESSERSGEGAAGAEPVAAVEPKAREEA